MLFHHLADIFHRIKLVPCRVMEKRYGLTKLLNTIPLLYHLGDWTEAAPVLSNCKSATFRLVSAALSAT
ncbi:hypothetical protein CYMTET_14493 [Cymbomonas tetramitiformis]|uniref:Uncharacterized protein n=1 Tax=Cymbomonas tetramitiformis TaxID=36881 RepID=A0AAE0GG93_9CHLO|nr:hypothetical protein CYMTET_14493 [Cymbomonas tetramitiformis]